MSWARAELSLGRGSGSSMDDMLWGKRKGQKAVAISKMRDEESLNYPAVLDSTGLGVRRSGLHFSFYLQRVY